MLLMYSCLTTLPHLHKIMSEKISKTLLLQPAQQKHLVRDLSSVKTSLNLLIQVEQGL